MSALLSLVPWYVRVLAVVALAGALITFGWVKGEAHGEAKLTAYQLAEAKATIQAQTAAAAITLKQQERVNDALHDATVRAQHAEAAVSAARAVGDGLRADLAQARHDLSRAADDAVRKYAATLSSVFGECTAEVERLAKAADGHASDTLTLEQAWPR